MELPSLDLSHSPLFPLLFCACAVVPISVAGSRPGVFFGTSGKSWVVVLRLTMTLEAIKYAAGQLQILDQLLLPHESKYIAVNGVEDGWKAIHTMQVSLTSMAMLCSILQYSNSQKDLSCFRSICTLISFFLKKSFNRLEGPQPLPSWEA